MSSPIHGKVIRDDKGHQLCWLIWSLDEMGNTTLHAVDTNPELASRHRQMLINESEECGGWMLKKIRVWVEKRDMDHAYGQDMLELVDKEFVNPKNKEERQRLIEVEKRLAEMDEERAGR